MAISGRRDCATRARNEVLGFETAGREGVEHYNHRTRNGTKGEAIGRAYVVRQETQGWLQEESWEPAESLRKCRHASHRERLASTNCGMQLQLPLALPLYDPVYSI